MTTVTLTPMEIELAALVGMRRRLESSRQRLNDAHGFGGESRWDVDIEGAAAELAYCKYRGLYWDGSVNTYKAADVGKVVQVRSTRLQDGCLIVRANDNDDHYFVLVVGHIPQFEIVGWLPGRAAKQDRFARQPNGREMAYFVPQGELRTFEKS